MEDARRFGAHHVVRRNEFSTASKVHSPAAIAAEIREHLLDNGTVRTCEVATDPRDPGIQGLLYQVGEATVARLYAKILEAGGHQTSHIELRFLTPGASGASICTVSAQVDGIGRMSHFLKLSQAKELLTAKPNEAGGPRKCSHHRTCSFSTVLPFRLGQSMTGTRWAAHSSNGPPRCAMAASQRPTARTCGHC